MRVGSSLLLFCLVGGGVGGWVGGVGCGGKEKAVPGVDGWMGWVEGEGGCHMRTDLGLVLAEETVTVVVHVVVLGVHEGEEGEEEEEEEDVVLHGRRRRHGLGRACWKQCGGEGLTRPHLVCVHWCMGVAVSTGGGVGWGCGGCCA